MIVQELGLLVNHLEVRWKEVSCSSTISNKELNIWSSYWKFIIVGMHAWFAAAADTRYAVVVPIIGVQVR